jgi:hypothetical protein
MHARALIAVAILVGVVGFAVLRSWSRGGDATLDRTDIDHADIEREISNAERRVAANDSIRQSALMEILAGHAPALTSEPCGEEPAVNAWSHWERFTAAPAEFGQAVGYASEWERLSSFQGLGVIAAWLPGRSLEGPRSYHARTNLGAARAWDTPTSDDKPWMTPAQARNWVFELGRIDAWTVDSTLIVHDVSWPSWSESEGWDLGAIEGTLWIWSYPAKLFVCAASVHVKRVTSNRMSRGAGQMLPDSLLMRAAAQGASSLHRVAGPR